MKNKTKWIIGICVVAAFVATVTTIVLLKARKKKKKQLELLEGSIGDEALNVWNDDDADDVDADAAEEIKF